MLPRALTGDNRRDIRLMIRADGTVHENDIQACRTALAGARQRRSLLRHMPEISLMLPHGGILSRNVSLPLAAARNAMLAIGYDLDRLTPFRAEDVIWTVTRDREAGRQAGAVFRLLVAPRFLFEPALDMLRGAGISPTRLCMETPAGGMDAIPFHVVKPKKHPFLYALPVLALGVAIVPFCLQEIQVFRLNREIRALSDRREQAENLRREIAAFTAGPAEIGKEERRTGSSLATLRTLTDTLPDGTFLTALRIHEHHVTMEGQSKQATQLIGILEHDAAFTDASFSGPVTRSDDKSQDVFTINANAPD